MEYPKNVQFTILIKILGQLHEFNFLQRKPDIFETDTGDENGNRVVFLMLKQGEHWTLKPGSELPRWILDNETGIASALAAHVVT